MWKGVYPRADPLVNPAPGRLPKAAQALRPVRSGVFS
jgi:hypothetical protein